jgi:hypothetical protein
MIFEVPLSVAPSFLLEPVKLGHVLPQERRKRVLSTVTAMTLLGTRDRMGAR